MGAEGPAGGDIDTAGRVEREDGGAELAEGIDELGGSTRGLTVQRVPDDGIDDQVERGSLGPGVGTVSPTVRPMRSTMPSWWAGTPR